MLTIQNLELAADEADRRSIVATNRGEPERALNECRIARSIRRQIAKLERRCKRMSPMGRALFEMGTDMAFDAMKEAKAHGRQPHETVFSYEPEDMWLERRADRWVR